MRIENFDLSEKKVIGLSRNTQDEEKQNKNTIQSA
jgi:hypothetical protein